MIRSTPSRPPPLYLGRCIDLQAGAVFVLVGSAMGAIGGRPPRRPDSRVGMAEVPIRVSVCSSYQSDR